MSDILEQPASLDPSMPIEGQIPVEAEEQLQELGDESPVDALPKDIEDAVLNLVKECEDEDRFTRERLLRRWKKNEYYWNNVQYLFWSEVAGDWQVPSIDNLRGMDDVDPEDFEKFINVYKAHGEAIIAALSVQLPGIAFYPDDADSPEDLSTARAYSKIAELIQKHNQALILYMKALYCIFTQGLAFAYNYYEKDERYGTTRTPKMGMMKETVSEAHCSNCGALMQMGDPTCYECGSAAPPEMTEETFEFPQIVDYIDEPKGREKIDIFGPLHVKVPLSARLQEDCGYLLLMFEQNFARLKHMYPHIAEKITESHPDSDYYERWGRRPVQYSGDTPEKQCAVRCCWLRPWQFEALGNRDHVVFLKERFRKGAYVVTVNGILAEIREEALDDHWTISHHPLASNLHAEPMGQPLIPVQEMTNELFQLTIQTVEYGIPQTFADPEVLDFDMFEKTEVRAGTVTPARPAGGRSLHEGFYTLQTATLSREVEPFSARLESAGQFVVGSFPSIYGGPAAGSKTASEYAQSRAQALQRLSTSWKMMSFFWANTISRATVEFAKNMRDDERFVQKVGMGFINTWVKKAELTGKVGRVEPEASDELPMSQGQKRDVLMKLFEMQLPEVNSVIFSPTNANVVKLSIGLDELDIPGEADRNKQYMEIQMLLAGEPTEGEQGMPMPSVPIDTELDDDQVHIEVLKAWLIDEEGQYHKQTNPGGYMNCMAHLKAHQMNLQMMQMQQMQQQLAAQQGVPSQGNES